MARCPSPTTCRRRSVLHVGVWGLAWTATLSGNTAGLQKSEPILLDWSVRDEIPVDVPVVPTPHPGGDLPAGALKYVALHADVLAAALPVTMMLRDDTAPLTGTVDPFALQTVLSWALKMDFVFGDFETEDKDANVLEMIAQVKGADSPLLANARLGAYAYYPGPFDPATAYPIQSDRTVASEFYLSSGLTVAMPNCYPYAFMATHTNPIFWGENVAPNVRSALLWAPITRYSIAKQALPEDHLIIPWVTHFVPWEKFEEVVAPPKEDTAALVQHLRLRGADGYYLLVSFLPEYPNEELQADVLAAWSELDWLFAKDGEPEILNFETDKVGGVQWSAMIVGNAAVYVVSNLGDADAVVTVKKPDGSSMEISAPKGGHKVVTVQDTAADINEDGVVDGADLGLVLGSWGICRGCPADLNGDGSVGGDDLGLLLGEWTG